MSKVIVYTIDKYNMVVNQFECERELAIQNYWNQHCPKGRYFIANPKDDIPYKTRRKPLKDIKYSSQSEPSRL